MTSPSAEFESHSPPLGIIGGSAFLEAVELADAPLREVETPRGRVALRVGPGFVFLRRHGEGPYNHPHQIPHHAHALALESLGVRKVVAFASTGSLREDLHPGDVLVPDDYLSFHPPPTFAEHEYLHVVPELDGEMRKLLMEAAERGLARRAAGAEKAPASAPAGSADFTRGPRAPVLHQSGVYAETQGPRFETAAEVRMLAPHAHVAGMTAASEATLCQERGLGYAMVCIVDNYAHGVGSTVLTLESFQAHLAVSGALARTILAEVVQLWRARR